MWLAYCSRILNFVQQQRDRVLVLPQSLLLNGFEPNGWLNQHWGTQLSAPAPDVIKPGLLNDILDERLLGLITPSLRGKLNYIWDQLLAIASAQLGIHPSDPQLAQTWGKGDEPLLIRASRKMERLRGPKVTNLTAMEGVRTEGGRGGEG